MGFRNCGSLDLDDPESDSGSAAVHIVGTVPNREPSARQVLDQSWVAVSVVLEMKGLLSRPRHAWRFGFVVEPVAFGTIAVHINVIPVGVLSEEALCTVVGQFWLG